MNEYWIRRQIQTLENRIEDLRDDIAQLQERVSKLNTLKGGLASYSSELESQRSRAKAGIASIQAMASLTRSARTYASGMDERVNGSNYHRACEGLESSMSKVKCAIFDAETNISSDRAQISDCENQIEALRQQLRILAIQEAEAKAKEQG